MASRFDIEGGKTPVSDVSREMRWAFIRKVYALVSLQLFLCTAVGVAMYLIPAVKTFLNTTGGLIAFIAVVFLVFVFLIAMYCYSKIHPWNYVLFFLFTLAMALMIGATCTYKKGIYVLMAAGLTVLIFVLLTLFTFWAAKRGWDFDFLYPLLISGLMVLIVFGIVKAVFHMGRVVQLLYAGGGVLVFSGFIIFDTYNLIKRYSYDEYIEAACALFLDIINLFVFILDLILNTD